MAISPPPDLIWLRSLTVLAALHAKGEILLAVVLDFLIQGQNLNGKTPEAAKIYQQMVIAEFYRITFDGNYPSHKEEGITKVALQFKELITLEAQVLKHLYSLIVRLYELKKLPCAKISHPVIVFFVLVVERQIALFNYSTKGFITATNWKKNNAHLNRYPEKMSGFTGSVMKKARVLADQDDEFRKRFFNPLTDARKALMAYIKENHFITRIGKQAIPVRQGKGRQKRPRPH